MTILQEVTTSASPEVPMNENAETLEWAAVYGKRHPVTTALTWGYYGGIWGGFSITASTLTLTDNSVNYLVVARATGVISTSTSTTNWNNPSQYARVYQVTTASSLVSDVEDHRAGPYGIFAPTPVLGLLQKAIGSPEEDVTLTATEQLYETIEVTGTLTAERDLIFDATLAAKSWIIYCNTSAFGIRAINSGSPQSGVSIGVGKHAIVRSDGSVILRVTADQ